MLCAWSSQYPHSASFMLPRLQHCGVRHDNIASTQASQGERQNETQRYANHRVSALDPLHDASLTSDTVHAGVGTPEAGGSTFIAVPILVVWLYGTLVLAERWSGYVIMLVGSLLASVIPVIHVMGAGGIFRGQIAKSSPAFLFVWTLHALGVTGIFSLILSARGLWSLQRGQPR